MKTRKVFIIGFQKTGTTTMETALTRLGYRVYGGSKKLLDIKDKSLLSDYIRTTLSKWDAVQDMPWPLFYKDLFQLYPDAKFILTIRDSNKWIDSVIRHWGSIRVPLHKQIYGVPCAEGYEEVYIEKYERHNKEVQHFFSDKSNFLIMDQNYNFNYKTLCDFLEEENPMEKFPHSRKNSRKRAKWKIYRDLRSGFWNRLKKF